MAHLRLALLSLLATTVVAAQEVAAPAADRQVKLQTRVLRVRDEPLPIGELDIMSARISADGKRVLVGIRTVGPSFLDQFFGQPGWPDKYKKGPDHPAAYVYDCDTNTSTELEPVFEGKAWRLIGAPAISPDGRFVAAACTPAATYSNENVGRDTTIAIVDLVGDASRLLDLKSLGVKAPVARDAPALSRDAAFLAVPTTADIGNGVERGWTLLWNRDAGTLQAAVFDDGYRSTVNPGLSDDGRFLVVGADGSYDDGRPDVAFINDTRSGKATIVSAWPDGRPMARGGVWRCAISGDGSTVAFVSRPGPNSPDSDDARTSICVHDVATGERRLLPCAPAYGSCLSGAGCSLSSSGRFVAYLVCANSSQRVCVRDIVTARVAVLDAGGPDGYWIICTDPPALSADGRRAVFVRRVHQYGSSGGSERTEVVLADIDWPEPSQSAR